MNPFKNEIEHGCKSFKEYLSNQLSGLKVGESMVIDTLGKSARVARPSIRDARGKMRLKTKLDADGNLWVFRYR